MVRNSAPPVVKMEGQIQLGSPTYYNSSTEHYTVGDIWSTAWASDGTLFMLADDFHGFEGSLGAEGRNVSFCKLEGTHPAFDASVVNDLRELGVAGEAGPDGANWKGSGIGSIDGALYLFMSRQYYGVLSPDNLERKENSYLLRSEDGGLSWQWCGGDGSQATARPMFIGPEFAAPYFVEYGQDGEAPDVDGAKEFVYAVSTVGAWDNGDAMILGRVKRDRLAKLAYSDWEFYQGGDGGGDLAWGGMGSARAVLTGVRRMSMTGMHYLRATRQYLIMQWHYPTLSPERHDTSHTNWEFYVGDHPWGPFRLVGEWEWPDTGLYCPYLPNKFISADGCSGVILASGDFLTGRKTWDESVYNLISIPFTLGVA
jgi:hypothetical protein